MTSKSFIPKQERGSSLDLSAHAEFDTDEEAVLFFQVVKQRLLNINQWDEICQFASSTFKLMNARNQEIVGLAKENDYIRINIPGPGPKIGEGYDWVKIEGINEYLTGTAEILSVTVRPSNHPSKTKDITAHFFSPLASSTFQVKRNENKIYAEVHGRNELPNNKKGLLIDKIRNTLIAFSAKLGFSYPQWKLLVEGLVNKK